MSMWNAPRRWPENQGDTEWQSWSNWPSGHRTRHENDETSEEPEGRQWVQWAGNSGLTSRDVVGPPWGEEMEEEAQEQDGEVRVSSYIDDEGYAHETEVRVRMVRLETEEERRQRDEDEESENSLTTDYMEVWKDTSNQWVTMNTWKMMPTRHTGLSRLRMMWALKCTSS